MHRSFVHLLAVVGLACVIGCAAQCKAGDQRERAKPKPPDARSGTIVIHRSPPKKGPTVEWDVKLTPGECRSTKEDAAADVERKACDQVAALVRQYHPDANWQPSKRFLKDKLRASGPDVQPAQETVEIAAEKPVMYTASIHLELTPNAREELFRIVRLEEARERQWDLSKGMLLVLGGLLAIAGYLRLSEPPKVLKSLTS